MDDLRFARLEYKWNHFDVVRTQNGLVQEHWDEVRTNPSAPASEGQPLCGSGTL